MKRKNNFTPWLILSFLASFVCRGAQAQETYNITASPVVTATPPGPAPGPGYVWSGNPVSAPGTPTPTPTPAPHPSTHGVNGVNRVMKAQGWTAASGVFYEPTFWTNPDSVGASYLGNNAGKQINKPTFYFGGTASSIITDATMQWEPESQSANGDIGAWTMIAFINVSAQNGKWRWVGSPSPRVAVPRGLLQRTEMNYSVAANGDVTLSISSPAASRTLGPVPVPWPRKNGVLDVSGMTVRRVVGLTQGDTGKNAEVVDGTLLTFDGSWVRGLGFTHGYLTKLIPSGQGFQVSNPTSWDEAKAETIPIRYPDARNDGEASPGVKAPWIIDFTEPNKRANDAAGTHTPGYEKETTNIELWVRASRAKGKKSRRGPLSR